MIDVVWWTLDDESINRGYWDQGTLEDLFSGELWPVPGRPSFAHHETPATVPDGRGAVVVLPGRFHQHRYPLVLDGLRRLPWVLLIVTSDEERLFPVEVMAASLPNLRLWVQTPRAGDPGFAFGCGYPPGLRRLSRALDLHDRPAEWFFSGQMTHPRRREAGAVLQRMDDQAGGERRFFATPGFTQGMDQGDYWRAMARATVAPCPSGPSTPDSFRAWEALELGCVPLLDGATPAGADDYWRRMGWPGPVVGDWREASMLTNLALRRYPSDNAEALAWWLGRKRAMAHQLAADVAELTGETTHEVDDLVTVLVSTSPIPSHPSTAIIDETLDSVRAHLPRAEVLVLVDHPPGPLMADYAEYRWQLVLDCHQRHEGVLPVLFDEHLHQSGMTRRALDLVRTPLVLYVEHDTPLTPDRPIDWEGCAAAILGRDVNAIRFHHEALVLDAHQHLMPDRIPRPVGAYGVPLLRCAQWSQRPHLASADYYRRILADHFSTGERVFIEDRMHSVLDCAWRDDGDAGWDRHRLAMYAPEGDIKRSYHLDGRRHGT